MPLPLIPLLSRNFLLFPSLSLSCVNGGSGSGDEHDEAYNYKESPRSPPSSSSFSKPKSKVSDLTSVLDALPTPPSAFPLFLPFRRSEQSLTSSSLTVSYPFYPSPLAVFGPLTWSTNPAGPTRHNHQQQHDRPSSTSSAGSLSLLPSPSPLLPLLFSKPPSFFLPLFRPDFCQSPIAPPAILDQLGPNSPHHRGPTSRSSGQQFVGRERGSSPRTRPP